MPKIHVNKQQNPLNNQAGPAWSSYQVIISQIFIVWEVKPEKSIWYTDAELTKAEKPLIYQIALENMCSCTLAIQRRG